MFKFQLNNKLVFIGIIILLLISFVLTIDVPFFWDGISKSIRAGWILDNDFQTLIVPTSINSGHPPLWIVLLAGSWGIFGKTLLVARTLLFVVNIGVFYQLFNLFSSLSVAKRTSMFVLLVCLEPTLVGQATSLNNDMLLLFFTLFALNSILSGKYELLTLAYLGLLFSNLRGIYLFIALGIIHFIYVKKKLVGVNKKLIYSYSVPLVFLALFSLWQYKTIGWALIKDNSHRKLTGENNILKNLFAFIKCYLDYGRIFIFIMIATLIKPFVRLIKANPKMMKLGIAFTVLSIVLFIGTVPFSNPLGDRYYLICYILLIIIFINLIFGQKRNRQRIFILLTIVSLTTGHFWIYPSTISQSWDSSLAHLNYFPVKKEMEDYIKDINLSSNYIGTRLNVNQEYYATLKEKNYDKYMVFDLERSPYVYISNIDNATKDNDIFEVTRNWNHIKTFSQLGVYISLYKNPNL